jgi:hypothetical protein
MKRRCKDGSSELSSTLPTSQLDASQVSHCISSNETVDLFQLPILIVCPLAVREDVVPDDGHDFTPHGELSDQDRDDSDESKQAKRSVDLEDL